jgi:XTP/dITP diphosphohydrolase
VIPLLFATRNRGKLAELRRLVSGLPLQVLSPDEAGRALPEVEEDGATFARNAEKKASSYARAAGMHALADDSGLCVDVLYGLPGVRSARWSEGDEPALSSPACGLQEMGRAELGADAARAERDEANNRKLLRGLAGVEDELRGAGYQAVLALAAPDGTILATVSGSCRGRIGLEPRGSGGFGYDPLFLPEAHPDRTMAELSPEEKDAISHRGEAFRKMRPHLEALAAAFDKSRGQG